MIQWSLSIERKKNQITTRASDLLYVSHSLCSQIIVYKLLSTDIILILHIEIGKYPIETSCK